MSDTAWINSLSDSLEPGDEVLINDRSRPLTTTSRDIISGPGFQKHEVWMEGNGTEYLMRYSVDSDTDYPRLFTKSQWIRVESEDMEDWYVVETEGETVEELDIAGKNLQILADTTASELLELDSDDRPPVVSEPEDLKDEQTVESIHGECPDCSGPLVKHNQMVECRCCGNWCPLDEWEAFRNAEM